LAPAIVGVFYLRKSSGSLAMFAAQSAASRRRGLVDNIYLMELHWR
jgi:hypothetical protein